MTGGALALEAAAFGAAVAISLWVLSRLLPGPQRRWPPVLQLAIAAGTATACAAGAFAAARQARSAEAERAAHRPIEVPEDGYVSSDACRSCHPRQYETWHASYHRTMTQVATPATVRAPFAGENLRLGWTYTLETLGDELWVHTDDPRYGEPVAGARAVSRRVVLRTGSHHEQAFWLETGEGRKVGAFPFIWRIEEQRWVPFLSVFLTPYSGTLDVRGRWNQNCIRCHTTDGEPRMAGPFRTVDTRAAEFGIACEACHGPGEAHVRKNRDPRQRYLRHFQEEGDDSIVQPARLTPRLSSQVCGQCHSVYSAWSAQDVEAYKAHGFDFRPGQELEASRHLVDPASEEQPAVMREVLERDPHFVEDRFWPDGAVSVSGREYSAMRRSECHEPGELTCLSCHVLHRPEDDPRPLEDWLDDQLAADREGNEACLQCHEAFREKLVAHTHHPAGSEGSRCYNCHMPNTVYGLLKATRSHEIDSPSVAVSVETGRPNACNLCHLDRSLAWSARTLEAWYGIPAPDLPDLDQQLTSAAAVWLLRGDAGQRALAAWHMGWEPAREASGTGWIAPVLAPLLDDPYDAVRDIAYRSLRSLPGFADFRYDYLGAPERRAAAAAAAFALWEGAHPPGERPRGEAIFLDDGGAFRQAKLERLLRQRDDRPVNRAE